MQLLQNFELFSWTLPPKWQIVATANPEGGDYSVTPMDDAMLTRLVHLTMVFDPKTWAQWAESAGVDSRGIDFVLTYPEVVSGKPPLLLIITAQPLADASKLVLPNGSSQREQTTAMLDFL